VSAGGRTGWRTYATRTWPAALSLLDPAHRLRAWVGRFDGAPGAEVLSADDVTRAGMITASGQSVAHALYPY
jgi:hypothetical protein